MIPQETTHKRWTVIVGGLLLFVALGVAGKRDYEMAEAGFEHRCDMIRIGKETGAEYGWPDVDNEWGECKEIFDEE